MLQSEGLSANDAAIIIQRCYKERNNESTPSPKTRASKAGKKQKAPPPPGGRQKMLNNKTEIINFAQNVGENLPRLKIFILSYRNNNRK